MTNKEEMVYRCPRCGGERFYATAHVEQDWILDQSGDFVECTDSCTETIHHPNEDDIWDCKNCDYSAAGSEFRYHAAATKTMVGVEFEYIGDSSSMENEGEDDEIVLSISKEDDSGVREFRFAVTREYLERFLEEDETIEDFLETYSSVGSAEVYSLAILDEAVLWTDGDCWHEDEDEDEDEDEEEENEPTAGEESYCEVEFTSLVKIMVSMAVDSKTYVYDNDGFAYVIERIESANADLFVIAIVGGGTSAIINVSAYRPEDGISVELTDFLVLKLDDIWYNQFCQKNLPRIHQSECLELAPKQICPRCKNEEHCEGAVYCKICGLKLPEEDNTLKHPFNQAVSYLTESMGEPADDVGIQLPSDSALSYLIAPAARTQVSGEVYDWYCNSIDAASVLARLAEVEGNIGVLFVAEFDDSTLSYYYKSRPAMQSDIKRRCEGIDMKKYPVGTKVDFGFHSGFDGCDELVLFIPYDEKIKISGETIRECAKMFESDAYESMGE